jgi:hypothetical protein
MEPAMITRTVVVWFGLLALAIANGGFREAVLVPKLGLGMARAVSSVILSLLIVGVGWGLTRWIGPTTLQDAWTIGALWVALTLGFEFLGGHYLFGKPWPELMADYNLFAGRIWVLVLIATLMTPAMAFTAARM